VQSEFPCNWDFQIIGSTILTTGPVVPSAIAKGNGHGALAQKKLLFIRTSPGRTTSLTTKQAAMTVFI
jgi:hypothetical protein